MILNKRKNNIKTSILLVLLMSSFNLFGQTTYWGSGSRDWYPNGVEGVRAYLRSSTVTTNPDNSWPFANTGTHYVYAKVGETIALASSTQGMGATNNARANNRENIELYGPTGNKITLTTYTGSGNSAATIYGTIGSRDAEIAGPQLANATGNQGNRYRAIYHEVTVEGVYRVEFKTTGSQSGNINYTIAANSSWTQQTNHAGIMAWDVSVINTTNTGFMNGRVYANVLNLSNGYTNPNTNHFYGLVYVLTKDGYTYRVDNNGNNGMFFTFFVNNNGFINENGLPRYTSLPTSTTTYLNGKVHNPNFQDGNGQITHKMFYSLPGKDLPETASISYSSQPNTTTWLNGEVVEPNVTNVKLIGSEGIEGQVSNKGGYINFEADAQGQYTIEIESDVIPAEFVKRTLIGSSISGLNEVYWDGKAGDGTTLPAGNNLAKITVQLQGAEVHFPFIDMEYNTNGIKIELLDHEKLALSTPVIEVKSDIVYWNDGDNTNDPFFIPNGTTGNNSPFGRYSSPRNNSHLNGSTGISSNTNGHIWGQGATGTSGQFGDNRSIDTWTFIKGQKAEINTTVRTKVADLQVTELSADKTSDISVNEVVTYTIKLKNGGPSDVENAPFHFVVPDGFVPAEGGFFTFSGAECGTEAVELIFDATTHTFKSELNLPNGCEVTYTIKVKVTGEATPGEGTLSAGIMRPYDVYDPDGTNTSDPENPLGDLNGPYDLNEYFYLPFDPFFEATNNGQSSSNNVRQIQISITDCEDEVLFYEDFGISYLDNGNKGRVESTYMPENSYKFGNSYLQLGTPGGNPWDDNPIRNEARLSDGYYAVVAPEFINQGWFADDGLGSWWPNDVSDHTGNSNTANEKGAVMAINAGEVLAPFYENTVDIEDNTLYKTSFWFYLVEGVDPTRIALDIFDSETNQLLGTVETVLMGGSVDPSFNNKWTEHKLYFLTGACSINQVKISLRNGYSGTEGNDYFIDDIKLVKWGCDVEEDFYVEIECPNPPVATPDINQTPQNTPVSGNVLTNDQGSGLSVQSATYLDENGVEQPLTLGTPTPIYASNGTLAGEMTLNPDGTYTFVPATDFIGNVPVNYTAVDENGSEASSSLEITVIPNVNPQENNPPIAQNDTGFTEVDVPLNSNVLLNDSDPENDDLIVTGALQNGVAIPIGVATQVSGVDSNGNPVPNAGTLTLNEDGSYTFVPSTGFVGTIDPITYTISDGNGGMDDAELFITVLDDTENNTFANDDANTAPKGETMTGGILENDTDPEGDTQTLTNITIDGVDYPVPTDGSTTEVTIPGKGVLTIDKDGNYTFVPEPEFVGTVVVEATVCDNGTPVACDQSTLYLTSLDLEELCFEGVEGQAFDWSYTDTEPSPVTETMTQPGTSGGFVFDIYELDNSFNMEINGIALATQEIEFQAGGNLIQNIRFTDGDIWEDGNVIDIWELRGDADNPVIRVIIDHNGNVSMYGSKVSYGPLFPLELFNGNVFNTIPWNVDSDNDIVVTQNVVGVTKMDGNGYGQNIVPCDCSKPGNFTSTGLPTKVGITSLRNDNTDGWPQVRDGAWIALESKTKGFVPNRLSNTEIASITDPVEGMMVYNTDQDCLQIYVDTITGWKCFNVQSCD